MKIYLITVNYVCYFESINYIIVAHPINKSNCYCYYYIIIKTRIHFITNSMAIISKISHFDLKSYYFTVKNQAPFKGKIVNYTFIIINFNFEGQIIHHFILQIKHRFKIHISYVQIPSFIIAIIIAAFIYFIIKVY